MTVQALPIQRPGRSRSQKGIQVAGNLLTVVCICYLVYLFFHYRSELPLKELREHISFSSIALGSLLWVLINLTLAVAWGILVRANAIETRWTKDIRIIFLTQIAKYLPGNVFQYAGRMVHYKSDGINYRTSSLLVLHEIALVASTALVIGLLGSWIPALLSLFPLGLLVACFSILIVFDTQLWKQKRIALPSLRKVAFYFSASLCYLVGFLITFMIYRMIIEVETTGGNIRLLGASTLSWVAGFLTPGSPGGVGIREVVFTSIGEFAPRHLLMLSVVNLRLCSIIGDTLCAALALLMKDSGNQMNSAKN